MAPQVLTEEDFPKGHPARFDYDPKSPEAIEWARTHIHPVGERDFPVGHPKAVDTKGNTNHVPIRPGIDPTHPEREEHTGASPEQAAGRRAAYAALAGQTRETPMHPEGFVDTAKVAEQTAIDFLKAQGHTEEVAHEILRREGIDQVLAAKATVEAEA